MNPIIDVLFNWIADNPVEFTGVLASLIYVVLAAKGNVWCWLFGIISSALYIQLNFINHLYLDTVLQSYYVLVGFYGWWNWKKQGNGEAAITSAAWSRQLAYIAGGAALSLVMGYLVTFIGNSLSYVDAFVTIFSFIATWMTARKILENWLWWIVIDLAAAYMYYSKGLQVTTGLYILYSAIAGIGYWRWKRELSVT
jgi:nicotinamide mononucleotide transporter